MTTMYAGGCQCGAVRFRTAQVLDNTHVCHCRMCQKASGGMFMAYVGVPLASLKWTKGLPASWSSSQGVQRGFCSQCGTNMFYLRDGRSHIWLTLGTFDERDDFRLRFEWGTESRLPQIAELGQVRQHKSEEDPIACDIAAQTNRQHPDAIGG